MAGGDGKPKQPAPLGKPGAPAPAPKPNSPVSGWPITRRDTSSSAFDLAPVGKPSVSGLPRVPTLSQPAVRNPFGDDERTATNTSALPRSSASSQNLPRVGPTPGLTQPPRRKSNVIQKRLNSSAFDEEEHTQIDVVLGRSKSIELDVEEETQTQPVEFYDGVTPAPTVTDRESWRMVKAPVTSRPGKRRGRILWTLIDQFAVAYNPRYQVHNALAEPRAHVFAWDVSIAMGCEIPHYRPGRELTLAQTVEWARWQSTQQGWKKIDGAAAIAAADRGELALAIPRDPKAKPMVAVVRPGGPGVDGKPRVATAGRPKSNDLPVEQAMGGPADFYVHL